MTKTIQLTQGKIALADDDLFEYLNQWKWFATQRGNGKWYACRTKGGRLNKSNEYMHRLIIKPPKGMEIDHINGDGLDNQKHNLRICTRTENNRNSKPKNNTTYKGVQKYRNNWVAQIRIHGIKKYLGSFKTPEEAAKVYDSAAKKHFGKFAYLNFPND